MTDKLCLLPLCLALSLPLPALAQTVLSGDHSVDGRLCAGIDCTGSESFGGSLKIKTSFPRLIFEDSSNAPAPTNDFAIETNISGGEYFAIEDVETGRDLLRLEAGAPENAIYLSSFGWLGLGTSIPQDRLHLVGTGGNVIMRLTATGVGGETSYQLGVDSSGFRLTDLASVPLAVDTGADDDAVVLRDGELAVNVGNSGYDFRVHNDAGEAALLVDTTSGAVGLGTGAPAAPLHVTRADGTASVLVENTGRSPSAVREMLTMRNNGGSYFTLDNTQAGTTWFFTHEQAAPNRFIIADGVADGPEMSLTAGGDLTIPGQLFTAGSCAAGCDRVFDEDYPLPSIAEQAEMMRDLKHLPNVGPTPENGPFNITAMTGGMLNELEKAHLYIAQLDDENTALRGEVDSLRAELAGLTAAVAALAAGRGD
ncbi:hypothetical protein ACOXXX_18295 [Thalassococcus sp. BH17M4-6]|uniref:hypothetical protein n=1 Tax=Thalassococcus sp. BH17M4-6 TaxID=3413148 RepID=UPI003BC6BE33